MVHILKFYNINKWLISQIMSNKYNSSIKYVLYHASGKE